MELVVAKVRMLAQPMRTFCATANLESESGSKLACDVLKLLEYSSYRWDNLSQPLQLLFCTL